jgi:hypothetical protein
MIIYIIVDKLVSDNIIEGQDFTKKWNEEIVLKGKLYYNKRLRVYYEDLSQIATYYVKNNIKENYYILKLDVEENNKLKVIFLDKYDYKKIHKMMILM